MRRFKSQSRHPRLHPFGRLVLAALAATATSCYDDDWDEECGSCGPPPPEVYQEIEPNDSPLFPDRIAVVDAYTFLYVDGHVEAVGFDIVDHLEFHSATPATYDFRIDALSAHGDVDVTIYDPVADVIVGVYAFSGPVEAGRITVHQPDRPFQIIIEAYLVDTAWSLELVGGYYSGLARSAAGAGDEELSRQDTSDESDAARQLDAEGSDLGRKGVSPIEVELIRAADRL
jgi:prepilin-type processing-associated H-X9-DG protein